MDSKKTSAVWLHFEDQEGSDTAKCNLCRKPFVYRGGCTMHIQPEETPEGKTCRNPPPPPGNTAERIRANIRPLFIFL